MFNCPSDPNAGAMWLSSKPATIPNRTKGQLRGELGELGLRAEHDRGHNFAPANLGPFGTVISIRGPFRVNNTTTAITPFSLRDLTDGTSNTMMISELKIATDFNGKSDARGDIWSGTTKCGYMFTAATGPEFDRRRPARRHRRLPEPGELAALLRRERGQQRQFNAARSFHAGG